MHLKDADGIASISLQSILGLHCLLSRICSCFTVTFLTLIHVLCLFSHINIPFSGQLLYLFGCKWIGGSPSGRQKKKKKKPRNSASLHSDHTDSSYDLRPHNSHISKPIITWKPVKGSKANNADPDQTPDTPKMTN